MLNVRILVVHTPIGILDHSIREENVKLVGDLKRVAEESLSWQIFLRLTKFERYLRIGTCTHIC